MKKLGRLELFKTSREQPDDEVTLDRVLDELVITGTPESVTEQIAGLPGARPGPFGELVYAGLDWADEGLGRRSMELMAAEGDAGRQRRARTGLTGAGFPPVRPAGIPPAASAAAGGRSRPRRRISRTATCSSIRRVVQRSDRAVARPSAAGCERCARAAAGARPRRRGSRIGTRPPTSRAVARPPCCRGPAVPARCPRTDGPDRRSAAAGSPAPRRRRCITRRRARRSPRARGRVRSPGPGSACRQKPPIPVARVRSPRPRHRTLGEHAPNRRPGLRAATGPSRLSHTTLLDRATTGRPGSDSHRVAARSPSASWMAAPSATVGNRTAT